ncbi:MAG: hypothetical protein QOE37_2360, partial [Microbacteriaceae bacterium]|nr:hypothetical protein [Microbacteriaceae bacterium]
RTVDYQRLWEGTPQLPTDTCTLGGAQRLPLGLLCLGIRFAIPCGQLADGRQVGAPGRIPHGIATELFRNAER